MKTKTKAKRETWVGLARELLHDVPRVRLAAAIAFILDMRHRRATGATEPFRISVDVEEFLPSCTLRQLKMLREIALDLEEESEETAAPSTNSRH